MVAPFPNVFDANDLWPAWRISHSTAAPAPCIFHDNSSSATFRRIYSTQPRIRVTAVSWLSIPSLLHLPSLNYERATYQSPLKRFTVFGSEISLDRNIENFFSSNFPPILNNNNNGSFLDVSYSSSSKCRNRSIIIDKILHLFKFLLFFLQEKNQRRVLPR